MPNDERTIAAGGKIYRVRTVGTDRVVDVADENGVRTEPITTPPPQ